MGANRVSCEREWRLKVSVCRSFACALFRKVFLPSVVLLGVSHRDQSLPLCFQTSCLCHHSKASHSMAISKYFLAARNGIKGVLWGTAGRESPGEKLRGAAVCSCAVRLAGIVSRKARGAWIREIQGSHGQEGSLQHRFPLGTAQLQQPRAQQRQI